MTTQGKVARTCPCCGAAAASHIHINRMAIIGNLDMSYRISCCRECGFLYASELPAADCYEHYYSTFSKYDLITSAKHIRPVDTIRAKAAIDLCLAHIKPDCLIVDLGCSVGYLLHAFNQAGWGNLHGIDPAPYAPALAKSFFGLTNIRHGQLTDAAKLLPLSNAGLVCLTGVLEHLWNPREELLRLFSCLRVGTLVLVEVPALERFTRRPYEPFGEFSLEHIQYFSERSLRCMIEQFGADTISTSFHEFGNAVTDSLFGLFRVTSQGVGGVAIPYKASATPDVEILNEYVAQSEKTSNDVIERLVATRRPWIIYGAGSHTARLLPVLSERGLDSEIVGIVDSNLNLMGKTIGRWTIKNPHELIGENPDVSVIISSFRAQDEIYGALSGLYPNPLFRLYPAQEI